MAEGGGETQSLSLAPMAWVPRADEDTASWAMARWLMARLSPVSYFSAANDAETEREKEAAVSPAI